MPETENEVALALVKNYPLVTMVRSSLNGEIWGFDSNEPANLSCLLQRFGAHTESGDRYGWETINWSMKWHLEAGVWFAGRTGSATNGGSPGT